jgi:hypothetical protein
MSHTPGPWIIGGGTTISIISRVTPKGRRICSMPAEMHEDGANARLITAAPEMLDCLERFVSMPSYEFENVKRLAQEVIAKAKGEL